MRIIICEGDIAGKFMSELHAQREQIVSATENRVKHTKPSRFDIHDFVSF